MGTAAAKLAAAYIVWEARRLGVPTATLVRMAGNVGLDFVISAIPVVGWFGDVFFRANRRNMDLVRAHIERQGGGGRDGARAFDLPRARGAGRERGAALNSRRERSNTLGVRARNT